MGCLLLGLPQAFEVALYPSALHRLSRAGTVFVAGGIFALLSVALRARRRGMIPLIFAAVGTLPLGISAALSVRTGVWTGAFITGLLALGVLVDAVRPAISGPRRFTTLSAVLAAGAGAIGIIALAAPQHLHSTIVRVIEDRTQVLGGGMLAASVLLVGGALVPRIRAATTVAAAVPFLALAAAFVGVWGWAGVLTYGLLGSALALEPVLQRAMERRAAERHEQSGWSSAFEFATEAAAWGFALLMVLVASIDVQPERRLGQVILAFCTSVFTIIWYHFVPVGNTGPRYTVIATAVYSLMGALLVHLTDGARSPYFFVYFLPIIALAWTQTPQTIVVPLSIPLAALLIEAGFRMRADPGGLAAVLFSIIPRVAGLLLIAGFTYLLARRNLENSHRIREARRQLEAVLAHMAEGLITTDQDGQITLCNPAAIELIGTPLQDIRGRPLAEVLVLRQGDGATLPSHAHPARRALAGQRVAGERLILERPDGTRALTVSATPLAGLAAGRGAIVTLRDSRAEAEMERMRDDFFFIASHELRTPLTVMRGNLEMALEASPPPALRRSLEETLGSTTRLIRMVNDFLDAARLEHGAVSLRLEDEQLPALVQQALETLGPDAARKGLTLTYRAPARLPAVRMDIERTMQILLNLIGNGIRYTQQGNIEITHAVDGAVVETIVRDTGVGIAPEHHDRLFSRFGQVERGLTRASGGSGLGLYISRKLAEQMGGTVVLKASVPGQGSAFALRLPVGGVAAAVR